MKYKCIDSTVQTSEEYAISRKGKHCTAKRKDGICTSTFISISPYDYCARRLVECSDNCESCKSRFICWTS